MENIKISVLITVFNSEKYIEETLQSLLNQKYQDFEIIIIDNDSKDKTLDIINKFKDKRILVKKLDQNYGQTYALNFGLGFCKGKYIARIDSDDIAMPERFQKQLEEMENKNLDLLSTQVLYVDENSKLIGRSNFLNFNKINKYFVLLSNPIAHPTVMLRRKCILDNNGYNQKYIYWQDIDLWMKFISKSNTLILNEYLTKIRVHKNQTSKLNDKTMDKERKLELAELINDYLSNKDIPLKIKKLLVLKKNILIFSTDKNLKLLAFITSYFFKNIINILFNKFLYIFFYNKIRKGFY